MPFFATDYMPYLNYFYYNIGKMDEFIILNYS